MPALFQHRSLTLGLALTLSFAVIASLSLVWTPHDVLSQSIMDRFQGPSATHWLGTDHFGRDMLSMLMVGARNSLLVALVAVGIGAGIGVPLGLMAAARGGMTDEAVMRLSDLAFAFPALLTAILLTVRFGPGGVNSMIAIGIFNIPVFARVARGAAQVLWKRQFVMASVSLGRTWPAITLRHVLPNLAALLIVQATIQLALGILADASLSYLGLGTQPPAPSLGKMLREAQTMMILAPQLAILPGALIILTVMGLNLIGDGLRDLLDPRLRKL